MKNIQKGFVGIILIVILALALGIGGTYFVTNKKQDVVVNATPTTTEVDAKDDVSTASTSTWVEADMYQNGTYPGFIKSVYKKNDGTVSVDVDIYQTFAGKQAFLELAKNIYYDDPKYPSLDSFKIKYPTYSELEKSILPMSEEEFDNMLAEMPYMLAEWPWTHDGGDNRIEGVNDSTIGGSFYKGFYTGMIYRKNESTKIRTFTLDKNAIIYLNKTNGLNKRMAQEEFLQDRVHMDFDLTIKNGVIVEINYEYGRTVTDLTGHNNLRF